MEIAKFVLTAIGTFLSVFGLSYNIFRYWRKKQEEKFQSLKDETEKALLKEAESRSIDVKREAESRSIDIDRVDKRVDRLETLLMESMQQRMSRIEGELKGIKPILQSIQNWFVNNTPKG